MTITLICISIFAAVLLALFVCGGAKRGVADE